MKVPWLVRHCSRNSAVRAVGRVVEQLAAELDLAGVPEPRLGAQYLLGSVLSESDHRVLPGDYAKHLNEVLTEKQEQKLKVLMQCRLSRMPVQYILGNWDFHHITLVVRPPVFIPRPETEQLVELVLDLLPHDVPQHLLEVGPGSGAVSLALLAARQDLTVTAVERSVAAVELCRENAARLGLQERLNLINARVGLDDLGFLPGSFDLVVSNPPYVLRKDLTQLAPEISLYEDLRALDGGAEGLDVILDILELAGGCLVDGGSVVLEVDPCHPYILPPKLQNLNSKFNIQRVVPDICNKERFLVLERA